MTDDMKRLNWLSAQQGCISVDEIRRTGPGAMDEASVSYEAGMRVRLFTIKSQRVYGRDLRDAIDVAMRKKR